MTNNAWDTDELNANGEMLIGNGSNPPSAGTLTGGTNCTMVNGANSAQVTFSGSTTGGWVLISSQSASSAATVEFTGLSSTYFTYVLVCTEYVPDTDGERMTWEASTDNGVSWDTTSTFYLRGWNLDGATDTPAYNDADNAGFSELIGGSRAPPGNATNETSCCIAYFYNPSGTAYLRAISYSSIIDSSGNQSMYTTHSGRENASVVNAIRATNASSGLSGEFRLYGMIAS